MYVRSFHPSLSRSWYEPKQSTCTVWVCASKLFWYTKLLRFVWKQSGSVLFNVLKATKSYNPFHLFRFSKGKSKKLGRSIRMVRVSYCIHMRLHLSRYLSCCVDEQRKLMCCVRGPIMEWCVFISGIVLKITSFIEHEMHTFHINLAHTTHTTFHNLHYGYSFGVPMPLCRTK